MVTTTGKAGAPIGRKPGCYYRFYRAPKRSRSLPSRLSLADVPYCHHLETTDKKLVYASVRRMAPKHSDTAYKKLQEMLKHRIIILSFLSSAWSFPMVIRTRKYGTSRFFDDCLVFNQRMRVDRFHLPKIQQIFDELAGEVFLTMLDIFSGYQQIKLEEECKQKTSLVCRQNISSLNSCRLGLRTRRRLFKG